MGSLITSPGLAGGSILGRQLGIRHLRPFQAPTRPQGPIRGHPPRHPPHPQPSPWSPRASAGSDGRELAGNCKAFSPLEEQGKVKGFFNNAANAGKLGGLVEDIRDAVAEYQVRTPRYSFLPHFRWCQTALRQGVYNRQQGIDIKQQDIYAMQQDVYDKQQDIGDRNRLIMVNLTLLTFVLTG